jgi:hypothetical protein
MSATRPWHGTAAVGPDLTHTPAAGALVSCAPPGRRNGRVLGLPTKWSGPGTSCSAIEVTERERGIVRDRLQDDRQGQQVETKRPSARASLPRRKSPLPGSRAKTGRRKSAGHRGCFLPRWRFRMAASTAIGSRPTCAVTGPRPGPLPGKPPGAPCSATQ